MPKKNVTKAEKKEFIRIVRASGADRFYGKGKVRLPKGRIGRVIWSHPVNDEIQVIFCNDDNNPQLGKFLRMEDYEIVSISEAEGTHYMSPEDDFNGHVKNGVFVLDPL